MTGSRTERELIPAGFIQIERPEELLEFALFEDFLGRGRCDQGQCGAHRERERRNRERLNEIHRVAPAGVAFGKRGMER
jgi:hypothetical protein